MKDWHKVGAGGSVMGILVWNSQSAVRSTHTYVMALSSTRMNERKERKRLRRQRAANWGVWLYIYIWNSLSKVCAMVDRQTRFGTPLSSQACWQNRSRACRPQGRGWRVWTGGSARGWKKNQFERSICTHSVKSIGILNNSLVLHSTNVTARPWSK